MNRTRHILFAGLFAALTATGAFIKIPFYPVPFTLQTFFTALAGLALPAEWAALSQMVYIVIGLSGIPVFSSGGGFGYILQPTFGYLIFLPLSAYTISKWTFRPGRRSMVKTLMIVMAGMLITLCGGALWLCFYFRYIVQKDISLFQIVYSGMIIFLPAMVIKALLAGFIWNALKRRYPNIGIENFKKITQ
ncbi:biotin transporter BioY [candidate division KSB1 bacterium]|nr:biotin transporter BioY [candidate division KSB1 bacterium]